MKEQGYGVHVILLALEWPRTEKDLSARIEIAVSCPAQPLSFLFVLAGETGSRQVRFAVGSKAPEPSTEAERKDD